MFDIGADELLLIVVVAIVVIGPKDLPRAMRLAGQWIAKVRRVSGHFRSGIETMIREAELAEMEQKWREQNEAILKANPPEPLAVPEASAEAALPSPSPVESVPLVEPEKQEQPEAQLPLPPP
jgi:sec-independent protein translocase protein TatB